ncbi:MAG: hypothetical protein JO112_08450 [Planctomycetes bacterium]|nr:hypothetical protein [Planctomycetota bacterium]
MIQKPLLMGGFILMATLMFAAPGFCADPLSMQWRTKYTVQGQTIQAQVILNGDGTGTYTLDDGTQGDLSNVNFIPTVNKPGTPFSAGTYTGGWSLSGDSGSFFWTVNTVNFTSFSGRWSNSASGDSGNWTGQRSSGPVHP